MAQVNNQAELIAALAVQDPLIQFASDFSLTSQVAILYSVTFESVSTDIIRVLSKDASFYSYLIRISNNGALNVRNLIIDGVKDEHTTADTENRSLVFVAGGTLTLKSGAVLRNNRSYMEGGGVYLSGSAAYTNTFVMEDDAQIIGCSSRTAGGGIIAALRNNDDRVIIRGNALFSDNTASNGGGMYYRSYLEGVGVPLTIGDNVSFLNNTATSNGGGIYVSGFSGGGSAATPLTLEGAVSVQSNQGNNGGGIYYYGANDGDGLNISGAVNISDNTAAANGGGLNVTSVSGDLAVTLTDLTVARNQGGSGGGVYITSTVGCNLSLSSFTINENRAVIGSGGGIWFGTNTSSAKPFTCEFNGLAVTDNAAAVHGGGLYFQSSSSPLSFTMDNCGVLTNTAAQSGGGMLFNAVGSLSISGSGITGNTCGQTGGGFYLNTNQNIDSTILMTNVTVSENTAEVSGGGLRLGTGDGTLTTTLTDTVIEGNRSVTSSGGGIWNGGANANLTVNGNSLILGNATEAGNGGGIYFNSSSGGALLLEGDTKIRYNTADTTFSSFGNNGGGISIVPGILTIRGNTEISNNSALQAGGGISLAETTVADLQGKAIFDNSSSGVGGGIYNTAGSRVSVNGMQIYGNRATVGGGIYNRNGGTVAVVQDSAVNGNAPNTATLYAPGVYNDATLETADAPDIGNGLYLTKRETVAQIIRPLESSAVIQLDLSGYVAPNSQGTPIVVAVGTTDYPVLCETDAKAFKKPLENFDGWEIRLSNDSTQVLLAPVAYTVEYENLMGATHTNPTVYYVTSPTITLEEPSSLIGYRFVGWFNVNGEEINQIPSGSTGNLVLYANWETVYRLIRYLPNDDGGPAAEGIPESITVIEGGSAVLSNSIPVRDGYRFMSWNTNADGTGERYLPSESVEPVTSDVDLYAQWEFIGSDCGSLIYNANADGDYSVCCLPPEMPFCLGEKYRISCLIPTRCCYCFVGWNTEPDASGDWYMPGELIVGEKTDCILYAIWQCY